MHDSCMATKTITLEIDAYEKLRSAKKPGESFSAVVRRMSIENSVPTGDYLASYFLSGGSGVPEKWLTAVEEAEAKDIAPDNPWA